MPAVKGGAAQIYNGPSWREASDDQAVVVTWEPEKNKAGPFGPAH
jgi:hypothetical protein